MLPRFYFSSPAGKSNPHPPREWILFEVIWGESYDKYRYIEKMEIR
jgi:hypothetical protein